MLRREFILFGAAAIALPASAWAQTNPFANALVLRLQKDGYTHFWISRTWLGRLRIRALSEMYRREIIMNPNTGEILRDFWELIGEGGSSKSGLFNPDDDNRYYEHDDDDDDDDDDEDNSGSGSSNSGSGSSNSGSGSGN